MISTVMLASSLLLFVVGYIVSPWDYHVSLSEETHVGVWARGLDSRIVFFNNSEYGPYRGSIIGLVDAKGNVYPPLVREESFGDSWGIYYRYFQWSDSILWTLMLPCGIDCPFCDNATVTTGVFLGRLARIKRRRTKR